MACHAGGDAPRRRKEEMPRAASRVDNSELQELFGRIGSFGFPVVEHWIERGVEQELHQTVRGIVRAGRLALIAFLLGGFRCKSQRFAVVAKLGLEFE